MENLETFDADQIDVINTGVATAEELVSNYYKMSASQWLRGKYDVKTLADLRPAEIVHGPYAQVVRYKGRRQDASLESSAYDFYKICLQDHSILATLTRSPNIRLLPFALYIVAHELIHIVRFSKFLQNFDAPQHEKMVEEALVHELTHAILLPVSVDGLEDVLNFYAAWRQPIETLRDDK